MKQALIAAPISNALKQLLLQKEYQLIFIDTNNSSTSTQPSTLNVQQVSGIITSNKLILDQTELEKYSSLQWIARLGSGMEIIDTHYCDAHHIQYVSSPIGISNSVAEHVTGMLLSLLHRIHSSFEEIKNGHWIREANRGIELAGQTIGIIGYGHTGAAFAKKMTAFTSNVLVYDKYKQGFGTYQIEESSLEYIQEHADIISFHVPLNTETRGYYNDEFLMRMQRSHILLNASRGGIIDTRVILSGLKSGKISGACLDVLQEEKEIETILQDGQNIIQELCKHRVIITPHIAGYSMNAIENMSEELMQQLSTFI